MQPVLSLVPAAILVLATLAPGGAGAETTRAGDTCRARAGAGPDGQGQDRAAAPAGWRGRRLARPHRAAARLLLGRPPAAHHRARLRRRQLPVRHAVLLLRRPVLLQARVQPAALPLRADAPFPTCALPHSPPTPTAVTFMPSPMVGPAAVAAVVAALLSSSGCRSWPARSWPRVVAERVGDAVLPGVAPQACVAGRAGWPPAPPRRREPQRLGLRPPRQPPRPGRTPGPARGGTGPRGTAPAPRHSRVAGPARDLLPARAGSERGEGRPLRPPSRSGRDELLDLVDERRLRLDQQAARLGGRQPGGALHLGITAVAARAARPLDRVGVAADGGGVEVRGLDREGQDLLASAPAGSGRAGRAGRRAAGRSPRRTRAAPPRPAPRPPPARP